MKNIFNHESLKRWFEEEKRDLPWRKNPTPYEVWVSEIMLQQTQVSVVIPYYLRWMETFPTLQCLAEAPLDHVIKMWEGLGYYSRVRNLHAGARYVMDVHNGKIPEGESDLKKIKGLGPYTIGALRSFAFHQRAAAVDGNVLRVLARFFLIEEDLSKPKTISKIRQLAEEILPEKEPWVISEALIELGATHCSKKAACFKCPLNKNCQSFLQGAVDRIPFKSKKVKAEYLHRAVAVLRWEDYFLIKRGEKSKIMSDLHEFPYFEITSKGINEKKMQEIIKTHLKLEGEWESSLEEIRHSFTRFYVRLFPFCFKIKSMVAVDGYQWISLQDLKKLAFSSGHRRIFNKFLLN